MTPQEQAMRVKRQSILHRYRDEKSLETIDALRELEDLDKEYAAANAQPHYALMRHVDAGRDAIRASEGRMTVTCAAVRGLMEDLKKFLEENEQ